MPFARVRSSRHATARAAVRGCLPAKTFSATLRSWKIAGSWYIATMPSRCAVGGSLIAVGTPSIRTSPSSGWTIPARILTSVDLPAPFSPTSACTERGSIEKLTSESARTPP